MSIKMRIEIAKDIPGGYKALPRQRGGSLKDNYIAVFKRGKTFVYVKYHQGNRCSCMRGSERVIFVSNNAAWNNRIVRVGCTECRKVNGEYKVADLANKIRSMRTGLSTDFIVQ